MCIASIALVKMPYLLFSFILHETTLVVFAGLFHEVPKIIFYYPPAIDPVKILSNERSHSLSLLPAAHIR